MSDPTVRLILTADGGQMIGALNVGGAAVKRFGDTAERDLRRAEGAAASLGGRVKGISELLHFEFLREQGRRLGEFAQHILEVGDELNKLSQKVGVPVETLSVLRNEAKLADVDLDALKTGLVKLSKAASEAAGGSKQQVEAFRAIGVEVRNTNGQLKPTAQLFEEVSKKFAGYKDSAAKAALAQEFFSKSGADLIPLLNQLGEKGFAAAREEAEKYGQVISGDAAKASEDFNDNLTRLKSKAEGFAIAVANQVLPGLVEYENQMLANTEGNAQFGASAEQVAKALQGIGLAGTVLKNTLEGVINVASGLFDVLAAGFTATVDTVEIAATVIHERLKAALSLDPDAFRDANLKAVDSLAKVWGDYAQKVSGAWSSAKTGVGDAVDDVTAAYARFEKGSAGAAAAADKTGLSVQDTAKQFAGLEAPVIKSGDALEKAQKQIDLNHAALEKLQSLSGKAAADAGGPFAKAWEKYAATVRALADAGADAIKTGSNVEQIQLQIRDAVLLAQAALTTETAALMKQADVASVIIAKLKANTLEAGLTERERAIQQAVNDTTAAYLALDPAIRKYGESLVDQVAKVRGVAAAEFDHAKAAQEAAGAIARSQDIIRQGFYSVADVIAGALTGAYKSFKDFGKALLNTAKQVVAQLIAEFLKTRIIGPILASLFNQSGGVGGSLVSTASSALGGSGGVLGSLASNLGSLVPVLAGVGGALYGLSRGNGGLSTGAAAIGYGALGYVGGSVALGAAAGFTSGAIGATGASVAAGAGGAAAGAGAAAYAIPVVGWFIAAIAAIDMITGGKVFGTKYAPERYNQGINIGPGGGTASLTVDEKRQRALFGGTQRRTRTLAAGPEAQAAAAQLFQQVQDGADAVGDLLNTSAVIIAGSFTRVLDKKGKKVKEEFSTVFGVKYKETAEDYATRMIAEAQIATVDAFLTGLNGSASSEAHTIAQSARSTAAGLAEMAQFLVSAAADIKNGTNLLGADGTLTQIAHLTDELSRSGETLAQTYGRLTASTKLLEQAASLAGATFLQSREDFVRLAADIEGKAGGLDKAAALWQSFFQNFYSDSERAQAQLATLRPRLTADLAAQGFSSGTTATELRSAIEERLPTATADEIVALLKLAEEFAQVTQLANGLSNAMATATLNYAAFIAGIGDQTADLTRSDFQRSLIAIARQMGENVDQANALARAAGMAGAREQDLGAIHMLAARQAAIAAQQLEASARSLIDTLYGPGRNAADVLSSVATGFQNVADSAQNFRDAMLLDANLSPLNTQQQYAEAIRQLRLTGDEAIGRRATELARALDASGADYEAKFNLIASLVRPKPGSSGGTLDATSAFSSSQLSPAERFADAQTLAQQVADLAGFRGESFGDTAKLLGLDLTALASDLHLQGSAIDEYLTALQADTYGLDDLSTVIAREVDRIILAIHGGDSSTFTGGKPTREEITPPERPGLPSAPIAGTDAATTDIVESVDGVGDRLDTLIDALRRNGSDQVQVSLQNLGAAQDILRAIDLLNERLLLIGG